MDLLSFLTCGYSHYTSIDIAISQDGQCVSIIYVPYNFEESHVKELIEAYLYKIPSHKEYP